MTPKRTQRLRARAAAIPHHEDYEDYGPEPNMKLSHAFLVVLLLHVVAVGGLYAFNSMKAGRQTASLKTASVPPKENRPAGEGGGGGGSPAGKPGDEEPPAPVAKVGKEGADRAADPVAKVLPKESRESGAKGLISGLKNVLRKGGAPATGAATTAAAVAQEATSPGAAPAAVAGKTYLVKAGDTVTRIAAELGVTIPDLEKANNLKGDSVLQVGQVLSVPEKPAPATAVTAQPSQPVPASAPIAAGTGAPATASASPATADQGTLQEYTVVKGDNPYKLAKKFRVTPEELMKANGITDPKKIQIGQKLRVPAPTIKAKGK